tara:strand:- start:13509 stop:14426 length:918 start_codon:yes stop_codon:yes gene_type:complete
MNNIFILLGPTASGKSKLSMNLSEDFPFEIINADLYSIYKGLDIGTAKPEIKDLEKTKHFLINELEPNMNYNVSKFCVDTRQYINEIIHRKRYPLIVGGSMMYIYQLLNGLTHEYELSETDTNLIKFIQNKYSSKELYDVLKSSYPDLVEKINYNDRYRIEKLLERIVTISGSKNKFEGLYNISNFQIHIFFININDREILRENIKKRTKTMIEKGLIDEVDSLKKKFNLNECNQSMRAIGYRETLSYLNNEFNKDDLLRLITTSTQQLAKRQITWKNKFKVNHYIDYPDCNYINLKNYITNILN